MARSFVLVAFLVMAGGACSGLRVMNNRGELIEHVLDSGATCNIVDYGAKGDGKTDSTAAIQKAIDDCSGRGGGTVLLPPGTGSSTDYVSGSLFLKSNIVFYISTGVTLLGTTDKSNASYPTTYSRRGGTMMFTRASLLNAARCESITFNSSAVGDQCRQWSKQSNITIAGGGTIDGNGDSGWWDKPYEDIRPTLLGLLWVDGLTIRDVHITNPPFWTVHPTFCNNVYMVNVHIDTRGPNTDGIDPDSTTNMLVEDCFVSTGDDCIAIKSGKDQDGLAVAMPSRNITIRNMVFGQGHGISIGSEMSGDVLDVLFSNLTLSGTDRGVRIKSQPGRGGTVAGITYRNMIMRDVSTAISISEFYGAGAGPLPVFKDILVQNVSASNVEQAGEFDCQAALPCQNITLEDVHVSDYKKGFECQHAHGTATNTSPDSCLEQDG